MGPCDCLLLVLLSAASISGGDEPSARDTASEQVSAEPDPVPAPILSPSAPLPAAAATDVETELTHGFEQEGPAGYLPEEFLKPQPLTLGQGFLNGEPILLFPDLSWPGGYQITPAFTLYGSYNLFATGFEQNDRERVGLGHQLFIEADLSLGATERIHAQWRPLGEKNTGGSFLQLNEDVRYIDNSSALPQRIWLEADLSEVLSGCIPDTAVADILVTAGLFPYALHNRLLLNDDIVAVLISKNDLILEPFSKIIVQAFFGFDEIDAFRNEDDIRIAGTHWFADWQTRNVEASYARLWDATNARRNQDFLAVSVTQFLGMWNVSGRALFNLGDEGRDGAGQLYVLETNWTRYLRETNYEIESVVWYATVFWATEGWQSISGGNFDRLRSTFAVNPLVQLSLQPPGVETRGVTMGLEVFALHKDLAIIPEVSAEFPGADEVVGLGGRIRKKVGKCSQLELRGLGSLTGNDRLRRQGVFLEWLLFF